MERLGDEPYDGAGRNDGDGRPEELPCPMECGICWYVYDPASGDPVWQIPAGVPFDHLPERWSCPECDAPRHKFLRVER